MRRYSYNEIVAMIEDDKESVQDYMDAGIPVGNIIIEMELIIDDRGLSKDDKIWEWSRGDKLLTLTFDKSMEIL